MDISDLKKTHAEYSARLAHWKKWRAVYDGTDEIIAGEYFKQHERESDENYERRCDEALSYGLSRSIVDLFVQYLFLNPPERDYGRLSADLLFGAFLDDCDYQSNSLELRLREDAKWASVYGHIGYLVDRPRETSQNRQQDLENDWHPYIVRYFPDAILDWQFRRFNGKQRLQYIKLYDSDGTYRLWWPERWEVWSVTEDGTPVLEGQGANPLGEIPFVWLYSAPSPDKPGIGISDMKELARFDLSIMNNISQGDEVITYAAFPMMRKPMKRAGEESEDSTGPTAVLEFNPEFPDGKPDWLEAKVKEPIDAILGWIAAKELRAHKHAHATFVSGIGQANAKSGIALQIEFTELGAALARKAAGLEECEENIYWFWARWQETAFDGSVNYSKSFDITELKSVLEDLLTARSLVPSRTFSVEVAKRAARAVLPDLDAETQAEIDAELAGMAAYEPPDGPGGDEA